MIKHHPKFALIQSFVNGDLPASLSAAIAIHANMCPTCQQQIALLTDQVAESSFETFFTASANSNDISVDSDSNSEFDEMIDEIILSSNAEVMVPNPKKNIVFKNENYTLPKALSNMKLGKIANIGKLARARLQLNENEIHTNLLHIEPGGGVPEHTHKGFELTLLLEGSFHDENGEYVKGDFIMLDHNHTHHPVSPQGCLCYTVANDALHFTQGINKLLNPIGAFIY